MHGLIFWRSCSQLLWLGFAIGMLESGWGRREPSQHRLVSESPSANVTLALTILIINVRLQATLSYWKLPVATLLASSLPALSPLCQALATRQLASQLANVTWLYAAALVPTTGTYAYTRRTDNNLTQQFFECTLRQFRSNFPEAALGLLLLAIIAELQAVYELS